MKSSFLIKIILCYCIFLFCFTSTAQKLNKSRQSGHYTYIYKLTDDESHSIYNDKIWVVDSSYFHSLIDSFPSAYSYTKKLAPGYYIKTYFDKHTQKIDILSVPLFDVKVIKNSSDLCLQVFDLKGNIIQNAEVNKGWHRLKFDKASQLYIHKKSNLKGKIRITFNGVTAFFDLERDRNNPKIKQLSKKVLYRTPLKYIWKPVRFVVFIPIDGVKSIFRLRCVGSINRIKWTAVHSFNKVASAFSNHYWENYYYVNNGYVALNKPKYLPNDTVKLKAYIFNARNKPFNKQIHLVLNTNNKRIQLAKLQPYRKGAFEYQFVIHDSLKLQLDRSYTIELESMNGKELISQNFYYEDYELKKNVLNVRIDHAQQFKAIPFSIYVRGTDENDLNLMDARLEFFAKRLNVSDYFDKNVFVPDTLLFLKRDLDVRSETEINIPDSIMPKANFSYEIQIKLITSDNEIKTFSKTIEYFHEKHEINVQIIADSLHIEHLYNNRANPQPVQVIAYDNFENQTEISATTTPCNIPFNPFYYSYIIKSEKATKSLSISALSAGIECFSNRTSDSIFIEVVNPHNIPFNYHIYKVDKEIYRGYSNSLSLAKKSKSNDNYFITLNYMWGGEIMTENYQIAYINNELTIDVIQPKNIYPGQTAKIEIQVTNNKGEPVNNVDLTAYGLTKKFGYTPPTVPHFENRSRGKSLINNFNLEEIVFSQNTTIDLDYNKWKSKAGLDTIEYYHFIYPENNFYSIEYTPTDTITQFAPFVVSNGKLQTIHVIYVDSKPVYFSWSTNNRPFSFAIDSGYHQIKLRTIDNLIIMDSMYFNFGKKLIFSVDKYHSTKKITTEKQEPYLSNFEETSLYPYILPYRNAFNSKYAYIENYENILLLNPKTEYSSSNFAGPINGYLHFQLHDDYSTDFLFEPYFEYEFLEKIIKMRNNNIVNSYPTLLYKYSNRSDFSDLVLTKDKLLNQIKLETAPKVNKPTLRNKYANTTYRNYGRLTIRFSEAVQKNQDPDYILIINNKNDKLELYPGSYRQFHQLEKGSYDLILFYSDSNYRIIHSIPILPDGINFYEINEESPIIKDNYSKTIIKLIDKVISDPWNIENSIDNLTRAQVNYNKSVLYNGPGRKISGYIYDQKDNEPIMFAKIIIKETNYASRSDIDGFFSLIVPFDKKTLEIDALGYDKKEIILDDKDNVVYYLSSDQVVLEEVVIASKIQSLSISSEITSISMMSLKKSPATFDRISAKSIQRIPSIAGEKDILSSNPALSGVIAAIGSRNTTNFYVIDGKLFNGDLSKINNSTIDKIEILTDPVNRALYGAKEQDSVYIIYTKGYKNKGADYDDAFLEGASKVSTIRSNFSDYAYWKPQLSTNKEGKVSFEVKFPDDVTNWETFVLGISDDKQTGQTQSSIKSYKPLMAQLYTPRFLIESDTAYMIGKTLNYSPDKLYLRTHFEINGKEFLSKKQQCINAIIDTLTVVADQDSLSLKYYLKNEEGYFDGEEKKVSIFPIGLEETKGEFHTLNGDTTFQLTFDQNLGKVTVYMQAGVFDVIENEIQHVVDYKYFCNEQLASKLKALIAKQKITIFKGTEFTYTRDIEKIISLLEKNRTENNLWGWWQNTSINYWISCHVLEALYQAKELGYVVHVDKNKIGELLLYHYERTTDFASQVRILKTLKIYEAPINYVNYIKQLDKIKKISFNEQLHLLELKQLCKLPIKLDSLYKYQKQTLFGSIYFSPKLNNPIYSSDNDIQNTILAYRIFQNDSTTSLHKLHQIRNYFLENRITGYWNNTYQSVQIIELILPDLVKGNNKFEAPQLIISGDTSLTITKFPFSFEIDPQKKISISKTGDLPIYITNFQRNWNNHPVEKKNDFVINTYFQNNESLLKAGEKTKLIVQIEIKKDADYVMVNVPIPAGCSYGEKKNNFYNEVHREYFKNETAIFCEKLKAGTYTFEINLIPRYTGNYTLNPSKVELMYYPTFNANNELKKVIIQ